MSQLAIQFFTAARLPALVVNADGNARTRFPEFFTANIRNKNTRRAYAQATDTDSDGFRGVHRVTGIPDGIPRPQVSGAIVPVWLAQQRRPHKR